MKNAYFVSVHYALPGKQMRKAEKEVSLDDKELSELLKKQQGEVIKHLFPELWEEGLVIANAQIVPHNPQRMPNRALRRKYMRQVTKFMKT